MLRITTSEFIIGAASSNQFPNTSFAEVAFAGRSNVGKSSLLNTLAGRNKLAKVSATPGKTRQINFFRVNGRFHFVDLPGYGYAKVAKTEREEWGKLIDTYVRNRQQLRLIASLVDIRHEPTALDRELFHYLESISRPFVVILTKYDKISTTQAELRRQEVKNLLANFRFCVDVIPFSSQTKHNLPALLATLELWLKGKGEV